MNALKFSIITCTLNSAHYLPATIASVKNQTFSNWEHIFIDGNSTDETIQLIRAHQAEFPERVRLLQLPPKGISHAMNEGVHEAQGHYIIHLHSDDSLFDTAVLQDVATGIQKQGVDWLYGKIQVRDALQPVGIFPTRKMYQKGSTSRFGQYLLKFHNYIPHQAVFIKKEVFLKYGGFDESISSSMDADFWLKIRKGTTWQFLDRIISNYALRQDSQSASMRNRLENNANYAIVQKRYLNSIERLGAKVLNFVIALKNKNYR